MHHASGISQTREETEKRGIDKEEVFQNSMYAQLRVKTFFKKICKSVIIYTYEGLFFFCNPSQKYATKMMSSSENTLILLAPL